MRPLRIGRASGSCRLTSRVALSGVCPARPGPGLGDDLRGALGRDHQLVERPPEPAAHPPAESPGQGPAAVGQYRGGLRRCLLRQLKTRALTRMHAYALAWVLIRSFLQILSRD